MSGKIKISDKSAGLKRPSDDNQHLSHGHQGHNNSPFTLANEQSYEAWRDEKLSHYPLKNENLFVSVETLDKITPEEKAAVLDRCKKYNMAIYQSNDPHCSPETLKNFARHFNLIRLDQHYCNDNEGITALKVSDANQKGGFVPYSDKALNWHTDGYYNPPDEQVYATLLHCHTPAFEGGCNSLMDHEVAYIRLRDENPAYIKALMDDGAMTIPAHIQNGKVLRGDQAGPVFSVYGGGEKLHMRFSQRKRNIVWRDDGITAEAVAFLNHILEGDKSDMVHIKLKEGQGIIANNILHNRSAFKDHEGRTRLIYRGRFFDPVSAD